MDVMRPPRPIRRRIWWGSFILFTALGGLVVLATAVTIFVGVLDPQVPATGRRGIQPR